MKNKKNNSFHRTGYTNKENKKEFITRTDMDNLAKNTKAIIEQDNNSIVINKKNFEKAKNRIQEFEKSASEKEKLELEKVETDGFLGIFDHRVTGKELNDSLKTIQTHFIEVNKTNLDIIKEFGAVYNALDVLDKDYITAIVSTIKANEKTSNDVREHQIELSKHSVKLQQQQNKLGIHQEHIDKMVEDIQKAVTILRLFKDKLENIKHIHNVDKIWEDLERSKQLIDSVTADAELLSVKISKNREDIDSLIQFKDQLFSIEYLMRVDEMWAQVEKNNIKLVECENKDKELNDKINDTSVEMHEKITDINKEVKEMIENFNKKINYAYLIGGVAIVISIIEFILIMSRVR